ncbi:hypothetical protein, partial [Modestobacter sp. SYSU DS0511]
STLDVNQPKESPTRSQNDQAEWGFNYMALTFGTLLSSQGADAHETRPNLSGPRSRRLVPRYAVHGSLSHPGV